MGSWALGALGVLVLVFASPWIRAFLMLRGMRLSPPPDNGSQASAAEPALPCELAAIAELESWGFVRFRDGLDRLGWEPVPTVFLAHRELPHFAVLHLRGSLAFGLPVTFVSFLSDGTPVSSGNRVAWSLSLGCNALNLEDARADSVQAQWAFHRERAASAQPVPVDVAADRVEATVAHERADALASGRWVQGRDFVQPSLASAWRSLSLLWRDRKLVRRPFDSAATRGGNAVSFMAQTIEMQARLQPLQKTERSIKLVLLAVSLGIAWLAWGLLFDWRTAPQLIAILLVHELGHAAAMRAFGWTNLQVFFVPLMGAVATGGRPRAPSAWKDVVVLLAGPAPGLVAGVAVLASPLAADAGWRSLALMAVSVNAFNLLPLSPLDGGQLMAIAVFNRWPYARLGFTLLSAAGIIAIGWLLHAQIAVAFAVMLALGWRRELRLAGIERQLADARASVVRVCEVVCERQPALGLLQRGALAQLILRRRQVPRAGVALGLSIVVALAGSWGLVAPTLVKAFAPDSARAGRDHRSAAQREFDQRWNDMSLSDLPGALSDLAIAAAPLAPHDARWRDLAWLGTQAVAPAGRASAVSLWLDGGEGSHMSRYGVARREVSRQIAAAASLAPAQRVDAMRSLVDWTHGMSGDFAGLDVAARLRLAEAIDLAGDEPGARTMLDTLIGAAAGHDACDCKLSQAVEARAWFESAHGRPLEAIRVLDGPVARTRDAESTDLAVARAWAYVQAGDRQGGLEQMRQALHADRLDADFHPVHPSSDDDDDFEPWRAPLLAFALQAAGHRDDAIRLCQTAAADECREDAARDPAAATVSEGPWQARQVRERSASLRALLGEASSRPIGTRAKD